MVLLNTSSLCLQSLTTLCHFPLSMTFIDLKNAFGSVSHHYIGSVSHHYIRSVSHHYIGSVSHHYIRSVSHHYIDDILEHICLPCEVRSYITSLYSELTGFIATKGWKTNTFPISRGVFQGDTLSPFIFLVAFNPISKSPRADHQQGSVFIFLLPLPLESSPKTTRLCTRSGTSPSLKNLLGGT